LLPNKPLLQALSRMAHRIASVHAMAGTYNSACCENRRKGNRGQCKRTALMKTKQPLCTGLLETHNAQLKHLWRDPIHLNEN